MAPVSADPSWHINFHFKLAQPAETTLRRKRRHSNPNPSWSTRKPEGIHPDGKSAMLKSGRGIVCITW